MSITRFSHISTKTQFDDV